MIFIDASRYSNTEKKTGVENYSFHLINGLVELAPKIDPSGVSTIVAAKIMRELLMIL